MAQYGVDVVNPFDALEDGDGAPKPAPKAEQVKEKKAAKTAVAPTKAVDQPRTLDAPTKRGGAARFPRGRGGRGRGNRDPRRVFERRSGTGRGREARKGGYGGYDAEGTMQDDIKSVEVTNELNTEDAKPAEPVDAAETQPVKEETEEEKKVVAEEEKEDKTMTFDQFKEQQKKKAVEDDGKLQVRQVQVDEKKFKACKKLEKVDDNDYDDVMGGTEKEADDSQKKSGEKKKKKVKHLDEVLAELPSDEAAAHGNRDFRGGGRGRGRGRGFGPRGGFGRGGAPSTAVPAIADEAAFPKLGK